MQHFTPHASVMFRPNPSLQLQASMVKASVGGRPIFIGIGDFQMFLCLDGHGLKTVALSTGIQDIFQQFV